MKNFIKGRLLHGIFTATILLFASCNNTQSPADTKAVAEEQNEAKLDDNSKEKDAQFLVYAAEINLKQIQLGQLAQQKGTTAHVKELGKMAEDAHTKSQKDLTTLAQRKNISIPTTATADARDAREDLNKKSGKDFDKAFADAMVSNHKDAIRSFEDVTTDGNDTDIKNWAIATLPALRTHLNHSIECQKKCEKNYSK